MTRHHAVSLLLICFLLFAAGCTQTSIAEEEQIRNAATIQAGTPSATPTPTNTPTPTPTPSSTPTTGPTPTATNTPVPSPTPLPPTPTPNPALANLSFCNQVAGNPDAGRFSARITTITGTVEPNLERVVIGLSVPSDSVPPHAVARCISAVDAASVANVQPASGGYLLQIDLDGWLHDDQFRASVVTPTTAISGTELLKNVTYRFDPNADAGATLDIPLEEPRSFRIELRENPAQLVLEVAKTSTISAASDFLTQASGSVQPSAPVYYLQDGEIWSFANGSPSNLTNSPEVETAFAVSTATNQIAYCRAAPGTDPNDALATSALWIMGLDGSDQQELAAIGRTCAEPAFSPDGRTVAVTVDENGTNPPRFTVWTVPVNGEPEPLASGTDEWSRFGPQWLDNNRIVYAANAEDGRNTLFINDGDTEQDIGAAIIVGETYGQLGRPLAAANGGTIAVEATLADGSGAALLLLDANGKLQDTIKVGYWSRPVAWDASGGLFYLTTTCASDVVQDYALHLRAANGDDRIIAFGATLGGFGQFASVGNGLAYVTVDRVQPGPRGPVALELSSASNLWFWDIAQGPRNKLVEAQSAILDIGP